MKNCFRLFFFFFIYYLGSTPATHSQVISTIAGNGTMGHTGDGGAAVLAELFLPYGVVFDTAHNLYMGTSDNYIRKVSPSGIITSVGGTGLGVWSGDGGPATAAAFTVIGLAVDRAGNIFIADGNNKRIRKINTAGIISTFAGNGVEGYTGDGGQATAAEIGTCWYVATDVPGNVYIATDSNVVRKIDASGTITTIAGNGHAGFSGDGGPATAAQLNGPAGVACDKAGNIYITDWFNHRVRKVDASGTISTVVGNGTAGYSGDGGPATAAEINDDAFIAVDTAGNLYISDHYNSAIRKVNASGIITTIAGVGVPSYGGDGGPATAAYIHYPAGIARDGGGNIYFSDRQNNRIRMISDKPYFIHGRYQAVTTCSTLSLDTLLAANDSNAGITEYWSLVSGPHHGVASVAYTAVTTGSVIYPTGLTYTPTTGFTGNDTLTVQITDSIISDTTTIYIHVVPRPDAGTITGPDTLCIGDAISITLADTAAGGSWIATNSNATVTLGTVHGYTPGLDTILYIVSAACGADTASHVVSVKRCSSAVPIVSTDAGLRLSPNPNKGALTFMLSAPYQENVVITITNLEGQKVNEVTTATNTTTEIMLDVPPGVYIVHATSAHGAWNNEVVVTK